MQEDHQPEDKNSLRANENSKSYFTSAFHEMKKALRGEPHSLVAIRNSLDDLQNSQTEFTDLLKQHHHFLKESIVVLMDKESEVAEKQFHLSRFITLLDMHGKSEEETLYRNLRVHAEKEARLEGLGGQNEHEVAYQLSDELEDLNYDFIWSEEVDAKAKVLAGLVANHIREEENEMFPIAQKFFQQSEMKALVEDYIERCRVYLGDEMRDFNPEH